MNAGIDLSDDRVRRYGPLIATAVGAVLVAVVPGRAHEAISSAEAATTAPLPTTTAVPEAPGADSIDLPDLALQPGESFQMPTAAMPTIPATTAQPSTGEGVPRSTAEVAPPAGGDGPLVIVKHTWAQNALRVGTPLESAPPGTLPVGLFAGSRDRASYVRVTGTDPTLSLAVYTGSDAGDFLQATAGILACPIISQDWEAQDGQSFASAPVADEERCVAGEASPDSSTWSWDLSGFAGRGTSSGFALVPDPTSGASWQVSFAMHGDDGEPGSGSARTE